MARTPFHRFVASFVLPLVAGGRLEVRGLLGPGILSRFTTDPMVDEPLLSEVTSHMRAHLARLGPVQSIDVLPSDGIALAAVWHNLLAMTHPEASGRVRLRRRVRQWCEAMLNWVGPPRTAREVALRHAMLARLGEVGRVDTDVTFWAGSARYIGVAPPARLLAWKNIRRVREIRQRVGFFELLQTLHADNVTEDLLEPARIALALSPLTDVALLDRPPFMGFQWTNASVNALGDTALRGAFVRTVLAGNAQTIDPRTEATTDRVQILEQATLEAVSKGVPSPVARLLVTFHLELLVTEALGRGMPPKNHTLGWDLVMRLGADRVAQLLGLDRQTLERSLALDVHAPEPVREAPAAPLLARASLLEVST